MMDAETLMDLLQEDIRTGEFPSLDVRLMRRLALDGIPRLQHPLMHSLFYSPAQNRAYNLSFHHKLRVFREALKSGEWHRLLFLTERPFRIPVFAKYAERMNAEDYWSCLSYVYTDSENVDQHEDTIRRLLLSDRPARFFMMDEDERAALDNMPETLTIYKGFSIGYEWNRDFSFSLSAKVARWFARRYGEGSPMLLKGTVRKDKVLAYLTHRNEEEILVNPEFVEVTEQRPISPLPLKDRFAADIHRSINRLT